MSGAERVTIIGAGPVGALAGVFLARRGYAVRILERRPDMRRVDIPAGRSINLALANRGIDALERVGLMDAVSGELIAMRGRMIHDEDGGLDFQPYGARPDEVIHSVSRAGLNAILLDAAEAAGATIRFGLRCAGVDFDRRRVRLAEEAGGAASEEDFDVVIGADGGGSAVRAAIAGAAGGTIVDAPLDHGYKELTIPPGPGGAFRIEQNALHIWPRGGYMLIALPNRDGSFTATLFLPHEGADGFEGLRDAAAVEAFFAARFPDAAPLIDGLARGFLANPTGRLGTIRCRPWRLGGDALIIGDAAHAIVPFHGQGMNAGFEDCVALESCIAEAGGDWAAAFAAFERARKPDADAIADMALENYVEMRDSVRDAGFLLRRALAWKLAEMFPDDFVPRYAMVMFRLMPYEEAQALGRIQAGILEEMTRTARTLDDVDLDLARRLVRERLVRPAPKEVP